MTFPVDNLPNAVFSQQSRVDARAKVNLRLKIEGIRPDGYHLLSMLNVPLDLHDRLFVRLARTPGVRLHVGSGFMGELIPQESRARLEALLSDATVNLAARAAQEFIRHFEIPLGVEIELHKDIPIAAGLGGGSSDAGALLAWLWMVCGATVAAQRGESQGSIYPRVEQIAQSLGADVPYFLTSKFSRITGIGEQVRLLDSRIIMNTACLLVVPAFEILTAAVFQKFRDRGASGQPDMAGADFVERYGEFISQLEPGTEASFLPGSQYAAFREELKGLIENDLEEAIFDQAPQMQQLVSSLREIPDAIVNVSGSGGALLVLSRSKNYIHADLSSAVSARVRGLPVLIRPSILNPIA